MQKKLILNLRSRQIIPGSILIGSEDNISIKISISVPQKLRTDVVFTIDSSESMKLNDPQGIRITSIENFIEKMDSSNDRAGLVSWDHDILNGWYGRLHAG